MPILAYQGKRPKIGQGCYIAPTATLIGDVTIEEGASVWFGVVLRGDVSPIIIGRRSNIQAVPDPLGVRTSPVPRSVRV